MYASFVSVLMAFFFTFLVLIGCAIRFGDFELRIEDLEKEAKILKESKIRKNKMVYKVIYLPVSSNESTILLNEYAHEGWQLIIAVGDKLILGKELREIK